MSRGRRHITFAADGTVMLPPGKRQREFYYILATTEGRRVLLGPYPTDEEANRVGFSKLDGAFEVIMLKTSNRATATQIVKERHLQDSANLALATQATRHQAPWEDKRRKRLQ